MTDGLTMRVASLEEKIIGMEAQMAMLIQMIGGKQNNDRSTMRGNDDCTLMREFTPKQHAVIQMIWQGFSTEDMANMLEVSEATIKVHIRGVMRRASLKTRAQIAMKAERCMREMSDEEYKRTSGIPKDWCERPDNYKDTTKMLRTKVR